MSNKCAQARSRGKAWEKHDLNMPDILYGRYEGNEDRYRALFNTAYNMGYADGYKRGQRND